MKLLTSIKEYVATRRRFSTACNNSQPDRRSFRKDEGGNVAIMFALALLPMILMVGAGIDYTRTALDRSQAQDAIDAASLAVVKKIALLTDKQVRDMVNDFVKANVPSDLNIKVDNIIIGRNPSSIEIKASGHTDMTFMRIGKIYRSDFNTSSTAVASDKSIEVALVLDNSGSMRNSRIRALKEASIALVDILEENQQNSEDLHIGVVPFNHLVRLDDGRENAAWLDQKAQSSVHRYNLPNLANRFDLFATLKNPYTHRSEKWGGCVEARVHPYDITDTAPNKNKGDTFFVPFFNPDSNDYWNHVRNWSNDYVPRDPPWGMPEHLKPVYYNYYNRTFKRGRGPNYDCYVKRILPLTSNMNNVRNHINGLGANGWTNIHQGTIWGLRVLSAQEPYTQGKPSGDDENIKFLIIMSDGANTYPSNRYGAYGWTADGRISGSGNAVREMNKRTLESCQAAKNDGVIVYTVAYGNLGSSTTTMLRNCATMPENAFTPKSTADMIKVFKDIAAALNTIRLTK